MAANKPKFSPGLITVIITVFWLVVFGLVMLHGQDGINKDYQYVKGVASQAAK